MLTPSCVAAVGALISWSSSFTQAQRSALAHFAICPFLSCYYCINTINHVFARVGRALFHVLPSSNAPALSYRGPQTSFTTGTSLALGNVGLCGFVFFWYTPWFHGIQDNISLSSVYINIIEWLGCWVVRLVGLFDGLIGLSGGWVYIYEVLYVGVDEMT